MSHIDRLISNALSDAGIDGLLGELERGALAGAIRDIAYNEVARLSDVESLAERLFVERERHTPAIEDAARESWESARIFYETRV